METLTIPVINPITNELLYSISEKSDQEIDEIYEKAHAAEQTIQKLTIAERIAHVVNLKEWILDNSDLIIDKLIEETGKSRFDAFTSEIFSVCDVVDYYKGHSKKILNFMIAS